MGEGLLDSAYWLELETSLYKPLWWHSLPPLLVDILPVLAIVAIAMFAFWVSKGTWWLYYTYLASGVFLLFISTLPFGGFAWAAIGMAAFLPWYIIIDAKATNQ